MSIVPNLGALQLSQSVRMKFDRQVMFHIPTAAAPPPKGLSSPPHAQFAGAAVAPLPAKPARHRYPELPQGWQLTVRSLCPLIERKLQRLFQHDLRLLCHSEPPSQPTSATIRESIMGLRPFWNNRLAVPTPACRQGKQGSIAQRTVLL